jgi:hypothetical protein
MKPVFTGFFYGLPAFILASAKRTAIIIKIELIKTR